MKRKFRQLFLTLLCAISLHAGAQEVTYIHEHDIMSQFTTMETGAGSLSPAWYYNTFHKSYQSDANARNKLAYRTEVMGYTTLEQDLAEKVDSDYTKRAEVEAINIVSRSSASDLSWVLEKSKLDGKMDVFNKNINNIVSYGGSPNDYQSWRNLYNCFECAIKITHESYQDLGKRKKEYLAIYQDVVKRNLTLVKQLLYWNSLRKSKKLTEQAVTPERLTSNVVIAKDAYKRWQTVMAVDGFAKRKP